MDLMNALGTIVAVSVLAWIVPGPNMLAVMAASLQHGRSHGIATGLGLACAALLWALLAVLGLAVLFRVLPDVVVVLKLAGACYLMWLGLRSLKSALQDEGRLDLPAAAARSLPQSFATGFLVSMTNPKAILFYASLMNVFIPADAPGWFLALVVAQSGLLAVVLHGVTATVFSTAIVVRGFARARRWISAVFGAVFIGFGGMVAYTALRRS